MGELEGRGGRDCKESLLLQINMFSQAHPCFEVLIYLFQIKQVDNYDTFIIFDQQSYHERDSEKPVIMGTALVRLTRCRNLWSLHEPGTTSTGGP